MCTQEAAELNLNSLVIVSNPLVIMLFGGGLKACINNFFDYKLFFSLSKESEVFCARRTRRSLIREGAALRTDVSPDSERMAAAKPIRLEGDTPGAWSKSKTEGRISS